MVWSEWMASSLNLPVLFIDTLDSSAPLATSEKHTLA